MNITDEQEVISRFLKGESVFKLANRYDTFIADIEDILRFAITDGEK